MAFAAAFRAGVPLVAIGRNDAVAVLGLRPNSRCIIVVFGAADEIGVVLVYCEIVRRQRRAGNGLGDDLGF